MKRVHNQRSILVLLCLLGIFSSCQTLPVSPTGQQGLVLIAIQYGVNKFLDARPAMAPHVVVLAETGAQALQGSIALGHLVPLLTAHLDTLAIAPSEWDALRGMIGLIAQEVQQYRLKEGVTAEGYMLLIGEVFATIKRAGQARLLQ